MNENFYNLTTKYNEKISTTAFHAKREKISISIFLIHTKLLGCNFENKVTLAALMKPVKHNLGTKF